MTEAEGSLNVIIIHRIYLNKRRGIYKNFHASNAALIRWRRLFESWTRQSIILTMVLLFSVLIYYRINIFWFWLYQGRGTYCQNAALIWGKTVFKFNRFDFMYQYNCIYIISSNSCLVKEQKKKYLRVIGCYNHMHSLKFPFFSASVTSIRNLSS